METTGMIWTFSKSAKTLSHPPVGNYSGWQCVAISNPVEGHSPIENGIYPFGPIVWSEPGDSEDDLRAYGPAFIYLNRQNGKGLHGGGTGSEHPLSACQGWIPTEGCIRVQNNDLYHIALNLQVGDMLHVVD